MKSLGASRRPRMVLNSSPSAVHCSSHIFPYFNDCLAGTGAGVSALPHLVDACIFFG